MPSKAEIAGDGPERALYEQLITNYNIGEEVTLLGWVQDKEPFYNNLDIFCLPSRKEAFGLVILESMMHSLPVNTRDLPGPREIIAQSDSAVFVPSEDPISMANALECLIKDKALAKELGYNAFQRVHDYSIQSVGPILHEVLEKICAQSYSR